MIITITTGPELHYLTRGEEVYVRIPTPEPRWARRRKEKPEFKGYRKNPKLRAKAKQAKRARRIQRW